MSLRTEGLFSTSRYATDTSLNCVLGGSVRKQRSITTNAAVIFALQTYKGDYADLIV